MEKKNNQEITIKKEQVKIIVHTTTEFTLRQRRGSIIEEACPVERGCFGKVCNFFKACNPFKCNKNPSYSEMVELGDSYSPTIKEWK